MSTIKDGGPAFPCTHESMDPRNPGWVGGGLTMRDYFAAKSMPAIAIAMSQGNHDHYHGVSAESSIAIDAYKLADAMLKAREA